MDPSLLSRVELKGRSQSPWELWGQIVFLRSWPGHRNKMAKRKEILKFFPRLYLDKGIPAQDEEEGILTFLPKISDGIYGIRFSRSWEFDITGWKIWVTAGGQPYHFEPVLRLDDPLCPLMRGDGGRDEDDFFEVKCPSNFFSPPEVTQMDGVKGSPE